MDKLLDVTGITVEFGGITALKDVGFSLRRGELLGLIGPNGAGKTTLLRAIVGVVRPARGRVMLQGRDLLPLSPDARARAGIALTHQIVKPFRGLSVLDNVAFAAGHAISASLWRALTTVSRRAERARARELLALVGIDRYAEASPNALPLGALKRLEVARALALEPKILLLDEPLAGLNTVEAKRLAATFVDLNRQGVTMVLIEHNLGAVAMTCPRVVVLDNGRKLGDGPTPDLLADPQVIAAYVGKEAVRA